jgi:hypothetical protein
MTLTFPTGEPFARGVTGYDYRPATARCALGPVAIEASWPKQSWILVVSIWCVIPTSRVSWRSRLLRRSAGSGDFAGTVVHGRLYRLTLTLLADQGRRDD